MYNIFNYIVSILIALVFTGAIKAQDRTADSTRVDLWQGIEIETDLLPLVSNFTNDTQNYRYEALARINLLNKYFPVFEAGVESRQKSMISGIDFAGTGIFYRLGIDMNLIKPASNQAITNKFLIGARLGMATIGYDIQNVAVTDPLTGTISYINFNDEKHTGFWFEIVAGIRIKVFRNFTLGWSVRNKNPLGELEAGKISPWYLPGFGITGTGGWSFNYMLGYQF